VNKLLRSHGTSTHNQAKFLRGLKNALGDMCKEGGWVGGEGKGNQEVEGEDNEDDYRGWQDYFWRRPGA
jgi:hypothetical protein